MNLTEPQIEAVFEWIDLNVDRKTAIRFVKDFYKPHEVNVPFCQTAKSKTIVDKTQGEFTSTNGLPEWMCPKATDKPWDPVTDLHIWTINHEHEAEKILEYKLGIIIESYSFPGARIKIDSANCFVEKDSVMIKCIHPIFGSVSAAIATKNFMNTGNTYWATIVK